MGCHETLHSPLSQTRTAAASKYQSLRWTWPQAVPSSVLWLFWKTQAMLVLTPYSWKVPSTFEELNTLLNFNLCFSHSLFTSKPTPHDAASGHEDPEYTPDDMSCRVLSSCAAVISIHSLYLWVNYWILFLYVYITVCSHTDYSKMCHFPWNEMLSVLWSQLYFTHQPSLHVHCIYLGVHYCTLLYLYNI